MFKQVPTINVLEVADDIFVVQGTPVKGYTALRHHFLVNFPDRTATFTFSVAVEQETKNYWLAQPSVIALTEQ